MSYLTSLHNFASQAYRIVRYDEGLGPQFSRLMDRVSPLRKHTKRDFEIDFGPFEFSIRNPKTTLGVSGKAAFAVGGSLHSRQGQIEKQEIAVTVFLKTTGEAKSFPTEAVGEPGCILRRFHFDMDSGVDDKTRPSSHFQYGGNCQPHYLPRGWSLAHYNLGKNFRVPRVPMPAWDLILVLDCMLNQVQTQWSTLPLEPWWKRAVVSSEDRFLKTYFSDCSTHIARTSRTESLLDFCDKRPCRLPIE